MKWISVNDLTPQSRRDVLTLCEYGITILDAMPFESGNILWRIKDYELREEGYEFAENVTHWAELEPPKQ